MKSILFKLAAVAAISVMVSSAFAPGGGGGGGTGTNVRVQWDTSSVPNLAGYVVLHGTTSGTYFEDRWAGLSTTFDFPVSQSGVHYFAVKVKDTNGNESTASTEVSVSVP